MLAHHQIDHESKLILTYWDGNIANYELVDALKNYQEEIKNKANLYSYSEIVDFSRIYRIRLSINEMLSLAGIAIKTDLPEIKTKLALIVGSDMTFIFATMYKTYRSLLSKNNSKEVGVFKERADALVWVNE